VLIDPKQTVEVEGRAGTKARQADTIVAKRVVCQRNLIRPPRSRREITIGRNRITDADQAG
jgi:hypothetical protein